MPNVAKMSPGDLKAYELAHAERVFLRSPLDASSILFPETRRWKHLRYLNWMLLAFFEYRLTEDGPGEPDSTMWWYETADEERHECSTPHEIPEEVDHYGAYAFVQRPDGTVLTSPVVFDLAISMMPRAGKSRIVTETTPIWCLGQDPHVAVAVGTYSDDFASDWGAQTKELLADLHDEEADPFPLSFLPKIKGGRRSNSQKLDTEGSRTGKLRFTGVGGGITGKGYQIMILDDPIKNAEEAMSETTRKAAKDFYDTTWTTRRTRDYRPDARFPIPLGIIMNTRWHQDDVQAHASVDPETKKVRPGWYVLNLPALAGEDDPIGREPGEALVPAVKTKGELKALQKKNPVWFGAMYQGDPSPAEGSLVPTSFTYFRRTDESPHADFVWTTLPAEDGSTQTLSVPASECLYFNVADMAATKNTTSDYTVMFSVAFHRESQQAFLLHMYRDRITTDEYLEKLRPHVDATGPHGSAFVGVENITYGQSFMQLLNRQKIPTRSIPKEGDKVARMLASRMPLMISEGRFSLPVSGGDGDVDTAELIDECRVFPNGTHDDIVDCVSFVGWVVKNLPSVPKKPARARTLRDEVDEHVETEARRHDAARRPRRRDLFSGLAGGGGRL